MSILVVSDIHGSLPVAAFVVERIRALKPSAILLLGDILYHGPRNPIPVGYDPKAVASTFAPFADRFIAIQGNCDSEVDISLLPFPVATNFSWFFAESVRIFATHGHIYHPQNLPLLREGDVFLYGHTHEPMARDMGEISLCNPGSLALPKEDHPPTYGLFDEGAFCVITMTGEVYLRLDL